LVLPSAGIYDRGTRTDERARCQTSNRNLSRPTPLNRAPEPLESASLRRVGQDRPRLSMQLASEISALSVASLYKAADEGGLVLVRQYGRTLVETPSLIEFMNSAEPWTPSDRGKEARAKRAANQARRA
jgi:hypothetical protein